MGPNHGAARSDEGAPGRADAKEFFNAPPSRTSSTSMPTEFSPGISPGGLVRPRVAHGLVAARALPRGRRASRLRGAFSGS